MSDRLKALREKRAKIVIDMRAVLDLPETEKREATADERLKHQELFDLQEDLRADVEASVRQEALDREMAASTAAGEEARAAAETAAASGNGPDNVLSSEARALQCFNGWLASGEFRGVGVEEIRALQADVDVTGGYTVAPEMFVAQLIKFIDDETFIRGRATTFMVTNADSMGAPSLDADPADPIWTAEILTGDEDSTMAFGKRELNPHPLAKRIKVSNKLMRISALGIESLVMARLAYKFGTTQENAFLNGSGSNQPLGLFTASVDGVTTARDVSTGNTTTAITFDGLIEAKYSVKGGYWANSSWLFHRDAMKQITKLKDGEGQYLWRPSVRDGEPDRILGHPIDVSEFAPNTFTTGLYVGLFGDFSHYWIADALSMQVQRLVELYAETNQTGFIGRLETDGAPVLAEAFARVKLA